MIRTNAVKLTTLPAALAYRRKAPAGGSAIVVIRKDTRQPGIATISKTSGEPIIMANTPADLFPVEAFKEAMVLTAGMPYHKQGKPALPEAEDTADEVLPADADGAVSEEAAEVIIDSDEYQKIVDAYTDKSGKLSYDLMNKDMVQLAHRSDVVSRMIAEGASDDEIASYIIGAKFRNITGNDKLTDEQVAKMASLVDEVSPKGAFKDLKAKIRSMKGDAKRA